MSKNVPAKPSHYYSGARREMLRYVPTSARRVLEVGCGEGGFGAALKRTRAEQGITVEVIGIEIVPDRAAVAAMHLDLVVAADVERGDLPVEGTFDCIVCNDVLEHLVSPWDALGHLRLLLAPGGCLVASIPNVRYWGVVRGLVLDGDWRYEGEGVLDVTHLRFFTRRSIARLFEQAGFVVDTLEGINVQVSGWKLQLLRLLTANRLDDVKYWQFAVVGRPSAA